ncbi:MAG: nickel pincer cofactor biosynthesis protein LarC [Lachnospiraceae bacterium]|nr:nickel pincer cofactor biosynthesis protein LarC [Lachnospiraceae bacterium]
MKTLYIECKMGVAGDMLTASLLEHVNEEEFVKKINSLNVPGVSFEVERIKKSFIEGNKVHVVINGTEEGLESKEHNHHSHHTHTSLEDVSVLINAMDLSDKVKHDAINVYNLIANAESRVHGTSVKDIHFHEVGTIDAIVDVVSVCLLMDMISPDRIIASPINVGSGMVECAHGILPVPAPATALLLEGIPMYTDHDINTELCTPTGAALIKYFVSEYGNIPVINTNSIGYGFGTKEFKKLNCVRTFLGEESIGSQDTVVELRCNIDDMTGEDVGFFIEKVLEEGALDAFSTPVYMKKNRPGILLTVMCKEDMIEKMLQYIFRYTTTIGVRQSICNRFILDREEEIIETEYGTVRIKKVSGYGTSRVKPEYEDIKRIANERNVSPKEIREDLNI